MCVSVAGGVHLKACNRLPSAEKPAKGYACGCIAPPKACKRLSLPMVEGSYLAWKILLHLPIRSVRTPPGMGSGKPGRGFYFRAWNGCLHCWDVANELGAGLRHPTTLECRLPAMVQQPKAATLRDLHGWGHRFEWVLARSQKACKRLLARLGRRKAWQRLLATLGWRKACKRLLASLGRRKAWQRLLARLGGKWKQMAM